MESSSNTKLTIKLKGISKQYVVYHQKPTFIESILNIERKEKFWALKNITLNVKKGQKLGIIGDNGSGKTTLLKVISGITTPTKGEVRTSGRLVSLIELNAGFHPDLTGEENIFLNGLLLGMNREEVEKKFKSIVAFSGIGQFIYAPFYTYSMGMRLRLGFSICIHSDADVYLFDESIYTGDYKFQKKIGIRLKKLFRERDITLLVASHVEEFIRYYCETCAWIDRGKIIAIGETEGIINKNQKRFNKQIKI